MDILSQEDFPTKTYRPSPTEPWTDRPDVPGWGSCNFAFLNLPGIVLPSPPSCVFES